MITLFLVFEDFQNHHSSKTDCFSVLSRLLVVIFHSAIRITDWKIDCDRRNVSQCAFALKKGFHLRATLNSSLNNHGEYIIGLAVLYGVKPSPNVQQGLKLPLMHPKSAGHKIPFCSHCHLLIPSRFVAISEREGGGEGEPETRGEEQG